MKNHPLRVFVAVIVLSAAVLAVVYWQRGSMKPPPPVTIQDGKTIDFSSGRAVVKDSAKEKAVIDKAAKEMEEATKGVTFTSPQAPAATTKKAETKK